MLRILALSSVLTFTALDGAALAASNGADADSEDVTRLPRLQVNASPALRLGFSLMWRMERKDNTRVTVLSVKARGVAAKAGLKEGDYLVSLNGQSIVALSMDEVTKRLTVSPGDPLVLGVIRKNRLHQITLDTSVPRKDTPAR